MAKLTEILTSQSLIFKITIAFITIVIIALMFPKGESMNPKLQRELCGLTMI
jgi:hypothetical protein